MKKFEIPEMEVAKFGIEDIITSSFEKDPETEDDEF